MSKLHTLLRELCPNGVEYKALGDIATDMFRGAGITRDQIRETGTPCVRYGEIYTTYGIWFDKCVSHTDEAQITSKKYFEHGDILFAITGESVEDIAKSCAYIGHERCLAGGDIVVLKHNQNPRYLSYVLSTTEAQAQKSKGRIKSKVVHSSVPAIKSITIPVPPFAVQEEVVRILDELSETTADLKRSYAQLKKIKRQRFEYYKDKLLTCDDVEYRTLGEIADFRRGSFPQPYGSKEWYDGENAMPFVQVADVSENEMRLNEYTKRQISTLAQPLSVFVPKGTIVVSLQGSIGRVAITQYDAYVDRTLAIFETYKIDINKKYFAYQLERKFGIEKNFARGSTLKTITKEEFTKFEIPVPPLAEQERIVSTLDQLTETYDALMENLSKMIEIKGKRYQYYRDKLLTFPERTP